MPLLNVVAQHMLPTERSTEWHNVTSEFPSGNSIC